MNIRLLSSDESANILIALCYVGKGDTSKEINVNDQLDKSRNNLSISKNNLTSILDELDNHNFIRKITDDIITVTRRGFYYVGEVLDRRPNNFHMLHYTDAKDLAIRIIQHFILQQKKVITRDDVNTIVNNRQIVLQQIIEIMKEMGLLQPLINTRNYEITSEAISIAIINRDKFVRF